MKRLYSILSFLFLGLLLTRCTKTEELALLPADKILEYKVTNLPNDDVIYGAIDNEANTITVYLPYYYGLLVIDPTIKVANGASLTEEILPVKTDEKKQTYTVKSATGTTRTYSLQIKLQSTPSFEATFASTSSISLTKGPGGAFPAINGTFMHTNPALVGIALINQETKERYKMATPNSLKVSGNVGYQLSYTGTERENRIPSDIKAGTYDVEVTNINHTITLANPLKITYRQPDVILSLLGLNLAKNKDWTIKAGLDKVILDPTAIIMTLNGKDYPLTIKSYNRTEMTVSLPATLPIGTFDNLQIKFQFKDWADVVKTQLAPSTITES
ncbi:hypothetical protein [Sphingobacterium multivorum]|uniref:Uncharacterized protein n=1 Tax=Sphingobacterium multivorum TaxID=28454 RepID=A0A654DHA9_SPHMU|nr:hypothetical protein [Sphingobacterium multivorum]QQT45546.1 hypothetical protein I6J00_02325 [Sphingobacterium multivorum]QQT61809.1 hypothetical protein I6I97_21965 [Sphingobacterium multivorum]SUJ26681.1 Uncharacterised protein [Sphingobacterium multivorum]VXD04784.1 conserved hypothetical protein [Sphingobacterium multivorum]